MSEGELELRESLAGASLDDAMRLLDAMREKAMELVLMQAYLRLLVAAVPP